LQAKESAGAAVGLQRRPVEAHLVDELVRGPEQEEDRDADVVAGRGSKVEDGSAEEPHHSLQEETFRRDVRNERDRLERRDERVKALEEDDCKGGREREASSAEDAESKLSVGATHRSR
jgi:hypothetical protein